MIVRTFDRGDPPGRTAGMIGTVLVHAAAAAFFISQAQSGPPSPPVYAVELLAAPAPAPRQRLAREAVPTPLRLSVRTPGWGACPAAAWAG